MSLCLPKFLYIRNLYSVLLTLGDILGNIRQTFIKKIAIDLATRYPNQFKKDDFQHNKAKVQELSDVNSKVLRNRIAGYVTRYLTSKDKPNTVQPNFE